VDRFYPEVLDQWATYPHAKRRDWVLKCAKLLEGSVGKKEALGFLMLRFVNEDGSLKAQWQLDKQSELSNFNDMIEYLENCLVEHGLLQSDAGTTA